MLSTKSNLATLTLRDIGRYAYKLTIVTDSIVNFVKLNCGQHFQFYSSLLIEGKLRVISILKYDIYFFIVV